MDEKKFTKEKMEEWAKTHKKEIALATLGCVTGGVLTALGFHHESNKVVVGEFSQEMLDYVNSVLKEHGGTPIMELSGKTLGRYLIKHYPNALVNGYINISGSN